jgi:hypothetical protein
LIFLRVAKPRSAIITSPFSTLNAGLFEAPGAGRIDHGVDYYNSNSFTSGLLQSVGTNMNFDPWGYQPGLSKPVPEYNFNWSNPW